jgi:hypothetical protein
VRWLLNFADGMKPEEIPLQPWARELYNERIANNGKGPSGRALLAIRDSRKAHHP